MDEATIHSLSYRDLQKECKAMGLSAKGKAAELTQRLLQYHHYNNKGL